MSALDGPLGWKDYFERSAEARTVMEIAQRTGKTFAEASLVVQLEDVEAELGWQMYQSEVAARRCPGCGTDPFDMDDERGFTSEFAKWKLIRCECAICYENHKSMEEEREREEKHEGGTVAGIYFRRVPREEGEPISPRGQG